MQFTGVNYTRNCWTVFAMDYLWD